MLTFLLLWKTSFLCCLLIPFFPLQKPSRVPCWSCPTKKSNLCWRSWQSSTQRNTRFVSVVGFYHMQFFFPRQSMRLSMKLAGWKPDWTNGYKGKCKSTISRAPVNKSKRILITTKCLQEQATHKMCNGYLVVVLGVLSSAPEGSRPYSNFLDIACRTNVKMCIYIYVYVYAYIHI